MRSRDRRATNLNDWLSCLYCGGRLVRANFSFSRGSHRLFHGVTYQLCYQHRESHRRRRVNPSSIIDVWHAGVRVYINIPAFQHNYALPSALLKRRLRRVSACELCCHSRYLYIISVHFDFVVYSFLRTLCLSFFLLFVPSSVILVFLLSPFPAARRVSFHPSFSILTSLFFFVVIFFCLLLSVSLIVSLFFNTDILYFCTSEVGLMLFLGCSYVCFFLSEALYDFAEALSIAFRTECLSHRSVMRHRAACVPDTSGSQISCCSTSPKPVRYAEMCQSPQLGDFTSFQIRWSRCDV